METLKTVREVVSPFVGPSGACADDQVVVDSINEVRRVLYELGNWEGTTEPLCIHSHCGVITLPDPYAHALKAFVACRPIQVQNDWFATVADFGSACGRATNIIKQEGRYVTFQDWPCIPRDKCCDPQGFKLKVIFESEGDKDVVLKFEGRGVKLHNVTVYKTYSQAWTPTPAAGLEQPFLSLTRVIKPKTVGRIRVYGYDGFLADPTNERLLAVYEPDWVNPSFARYNVSRGIGSVVFKAKKKYIPLDDNDQFVDIHTDALIHGLQAIADRKARKIAEYNANMKMATDFLNAQIGSRTQTSTTPMKMSGAYTVEGLI
jgi:hypothetical protein